MQLFLNLYFLPSPHIHFDVFSKGDFPAGSYRNSNIRRVIPITSSPRKSSGSIPKLFLACGSRFDRPTSSLSRRVETLRVFNESSKLNWTIWNGIPFDYLWALADPKQNTHPRKLSIDSQGIPKPWNFSIENSSLDPSEGKSETTVTHFEYTRREMNKFTYFISVSIPSTEIYESFSIHFVSIWHE